MAGPVLGVGGIVRDGGVEPQAVALLAVVEGALERARAGPAATAPATPPAAPAAPGLALAVLALVGLILCGLLVRLGVERGRHERVILSAEVILQTAELRVPVPVPVAGLRRSQVVLALEGHELAHAHIELMRDPGVRSALANPRPDLVELGLERPARHGGARLPAPLHRPLE